MDSRQTRAPLLSSSSATDESVLRVVELPLDDCTDGGFRRHARQRNAERRARGGVAGNNKTIDCRLV